MLTNLASYLLGYLEPAAAAVAPEPSTAAVQRRASCGTDSDDEWLLIDASVIENDENAAVVRLSRSASMSSLPSHPLEESWFLTPPPCFTSTAPSPLETSPLENLLIEHPSMSVYHGRLRARSASPPAPAPATPAPPTPHPRQPLATVKDHQALRCLELKAAAKHQKKQSACVVSRSQLERSNKAREVQSRGRRQRRADRQHRPSGANNNRKCC